MLSIRKLGVIWMGIMLAMFAAGCKKKAPPPPPPPPPAPAPAPAPPPKAPMISQFSAEPSSIERGQSATLRWSVSNATDINIDNGIGTVDATGSRQVFPNNSTTYTLTAKGPGGSTSETASVNVTVPAPPPPPPPPARPDLSQLLADRVQDAYFDYDKSEIRADAREALTKDADALKGIFGDLPDAVATIEGHCDERGSGEYNMGLGDRRAQAAKDFLVQLGVPADKLKTISYGKERPVCTESNESCWQKNRRAHFSAAQ